MDIDLILTPDLTFCDLEGVSKKRILETTAELIAARTDNIRADQIYDALLAREQLGSTGLGNGIAIPHCRVQKCTRTIGCLVKLQQPVDFDAIDNKPVDLLFFLLVPEKAVEGHLEVLRTLAENFNRPEYCQRLRDADSDEALYRAATAD